MFTRLDITITASQIRRLQTAIGWRICRYRFLPVSATRFAVYREVRK